MVRTCIFSYFDINGKIDLNTIYLLKELKQITDNLIFVVNGDVQIEKVQTIVDYVFIRENKGLDAGAYKATMKKYNFIIEGSNELILCNNTFFGPFIPMYDILSNMYLSDCDGYGLIPWKIGIEDYIQSYFLIFKESIFKNEIFKTYIDKYIDENTNSYEKVCFYFERELQYLLQRKGFKFESYIKEHLPSPYLYPFECLKQGAIIIKKKCFDKELKYCDRDEILNSLSYISSKYEYDINIILDWINKKWQWQLSYNDVINHFVKNEKKIPQINSCNRKDIIMFYEKNSKIYIYGAGQIAKLVYESLKFRGDYKKIKGFIVSRKNDKQDIYGLPIIEYDEKKLDESDGIIVAANAENSSQIQKIILHKNCLYMYKYMETEYDK